jgi:hypothetical protein
MQAAQHMLPMRDVSLTLNSSCDMHAALDTFVDYTWRDLTSLSMTIIVLLVVEVM